MARVVVSAATSSIASFAPLRLEENIAPLLVEETAQVEGRKVQIEIVEAHPKGAILLTNLDLLTCLLLHAIVSFSLTLLVPHIRVITPGTLPLSVATPRVSQLDQIIAIDGCNVKD